MLQKITITMVVGALVVVGGLILLIPRSHTKVNECSPGSGILHHVTIKNSQVSPQITDGVLCDKIIFTNLDNVTMEIAFGPHVHHIAYDGDTEKFLNKNQSFTITLNKVGSFQFHDHLNETIIGYFNVYRN